MARISNIVVASLNFLCLLWAVFIIIVSIYMLAASKWACGTSSGSDLAYGIFLAALSVVAIVGAIRNHRLLLSIYVWVLVGWMVVNVITAGASVVGWNSINKVDKANQGYRLQKYPGWLRSHVLGGNKWRDIKACMVQTKVCSSFYQLNQTDGDDNYYPLRSPVMHGCCKPPEECGFERKNETYWEVPRSGLASKDSDCQAWSSDLDRACYECSTCKAGQILEMREVWLFSSILCVLYLLPLSLVLSIACCAYRNAPKPDSFSHHTQA